MPRLAPAKPERITLGSLISVKTVFCMLDVLPKMKSIIDNP